MYLPFPYFFVFLDNLCKTKSNYVLVDHHIHHLTEAGRIYIYICIKEAVANLFKKSSFVRRTEPLRQRETQDVL